MTTGEWLDYPGDDGRQHTVVGTIKRLPSLASPQLGNEREILVYLPPSYAASPERRYPVLYMHDGQNLFDEATAFAAEWDIDATMEAAAGDGAEAIVVAIPNRGEARFAEYTPFADSRHGGGRGADYLAFVVDTVKARMDADFRTLTDRRATGVMGSSLGGLISLYTLFQRPDVFGFGGIMSPAVWPARHRILRHIKPAPHPRARVYLDVGTGEGWGEVRDVLRVRKILEQKGMRQGHDLLYVRDRGARHTETAWGRRFRRALDFFLAGAAGAAGAARGGVAAG